VRTTGRNLSRDLASEYAKRARAKAARVSTSWHNNMLALSEAVILKHAAALISRRRQLTINSNHGLDDSRWLREVECFIDEVIEESGGQSFRFIRHCMPHCAAPFDACVSPRFGGLLFH
jgi:hypothetical protein